MNTSATSAEQGKHWCCRRNLGASALHYIHASPEFVWSMVCSVEGRPIACERIVSVKRLDGSEPCTPLVVGSRFRQTVTINKNGKTKDVDIRVLSMSDEGSDFPRSVSFSGLTGGFLFDSISTSTLMVDRITKEERCDGFDSKNSCRVLLSFAIAPQNYLAALYFSLNFWRVARYTDKSLQSDLEGIEAYAEEACGAPQSQLPSTAPTIPLGGS